MPLRALVLASLLGILAKSCLAHVALTYPPARQYDLDFLDNARTPAPCGMPKGTTKTMLAQGSTVNVTWHLAYPHQGGFQLQILDRSERVLKTLAPLDNTYISDDPTAQSYPLKLPDDLHCVGCTLRLLRQASEWGSRYRFWSCADVDIIQARNIRVSCSGNGRITGGKCVCRSTYSGDQCQFKNDCSHDGHCGTHGRCIDLLGTAYPRKRCFCRNGYFGYKCAKASKIRNKKDIKFGFYESRKLSDHLTLYWRILRREKEIEVVMVNKGLSYAAVGWRPPGTTTKCREFPKIEGPPPPYETEVIPEGEPEAEPEGEPEAEPEGEPGAEPEGEPGAEPEGEPGAEPEGEPESEPEGEPEAEPSSKYKGKPKAEPEPEPEPDSKVKPEPEPESEPEPNYKKNEDAPHAGRNVGKVLFPGSPNSDDDRQAAASNSDVQPAQKKTLSLADRLAGFSGRKKRSPNRGDFNPMPAPLLKPAKKKVRTQPEPTASALAEPEPESESKSEPEYEDSAKANAEPQAETEPEPKSEAEPEPKAEVEGEPEPKSEAEAEPESEPKSEVEAEPESEPEPTDEKPSSPYTPVGRSLHPMDCTDIVIGMARGNLYLIQDYYTRDRSTPRLDEFWGGEDSITTAFGWEKDGETTILFRKKLEATHPTDHNISDSLMHIIWARGQEPNMYVHVPDSGLEAGKPSVPLFYAPDEIKYHGRKDQRGVLALNLFEQKNNLAQAGGENKVDWCGGEWRYPSSCSAQAKDCEYSARWEYLEETDDIKFTITSKHIGLWSGIGFSDDTKMAKSDVIIGWVEGDHFIFDGWLTRYRAPTVDKDQNLYDTAGRTIDGQFTLNFTRKRTSKDTEDLSFTDTKCLYMMFPIKGGKISYVSKKLNKHELTPVVSSRRICIRSCVKYGAPGGDNIIFTTTEPPPEVKYNVEFMIINTGSDNKVPQPGSPDYNTLVNEMTSSTHNILEELPGFVVADVVELQEADGNKIKALLQVTFNEKEHQSELTQEADKTGDEVVYEAMKKSVSTGRFGNFAVEPNFLRVNLLGVTDSLSEVRESEVEVEALNPLAFISKHKYWFIGAGIVAFIVLALLQALITMCRKQKKNPPPVSTKERLITNSRWRDYSRGNPNYGYETYEHEKPPESHRSSSLIRAPQHPPSHKNGRAGGPPSNGHPSSHHQGDSMEKHSDTRSLQRPRHNPPTLVDPRTTYSLPRGNSNTPSSPPSYNTAMQELTPDFYYLPSQRKYSGEVVRVYVDYNKGK